MKQQYVEIITGLPIDRTFQYKVPEDAAFKPEVGKRVHIPFRASKRVGYIVNLKTRLWWNVREILSR